MAKLTILEFPDPRLRTKAVAVDSVDDELRSLVDDLFETMYAAPGIGLAATQVDVHRRLLVTDVSADKSEPYVLINPEIIEKDGVTVTEEGCLSVPGYYEEVERAEHIRVRFLDRGGNEVESGGRGSAWPCASSTRWITSMASCLSTTCPRRNACAFAKSWLRSSAPERRRQSSCRSHANSAITQ